MLKKIISKSLNLETSINNFMPIACHYNYETLLTKNGELIQTMKINGLGSASFSHDLLMIQSSVRASLMKYFDDDDIACWVNNVRDKANIDDDANYEHFLAKNVHSVWQERHLLHETFVNTIYISFVYKHKIINNNSFQKFIDHLSFTASAQLHDEYLEASCIALGVVVNNIIDDLAKFNPIKLKIIQKNDVYFSENLQFYHRLISQKNEEIPVTFHGAYAFYQNYSYTLSNYIMQINNEVEDIFISVISLKSHQEISLESLNEILHLPVKITISEMFYPSIASKASEHSKYQEYILNVSKDTDLVNILKIDQMIKPKDNRKNSFFERQISITVTNTNEMSLENDIHKVSKALSYIGLLNVVEDVWLENSLWAQLPGNFSYLKRTSYTTIDLVAAFVNFYSHPIGNPKSFFGKALTILKTIHNNPYYFNMHNAEGEGLVCIIGKKQAGKSLIANFLVSESTKYKPQIIYIASDYSSKIFLEGLGGFWDDKIILNPFLTFTSDEDVELFCNILTSVTKNTDLQLSEREELYEVVKKLSPKKRTLLNILNKLDNNLSIKLKFLLENDDYTNFLSDKDEIEEIFKQDIVCFDLIKFTEQYFYNKYYEAAQLPKERAVFSANLELNNNVRALIIDYILKYYVNNGDPNRLKILVIENTMEVLKHSIFNNFSEDYKDFLAKKNIILTSIGMDNLDNDITPAAKNIIEKCSTKIILSGEKLPGSFADLLNITIDQLLTLNRIPQGSGFFFLQQDGKSEAMSLNLYDLPGLIPILSSNPDSLKMFQELKEKGLAMDDIIATIYQYLIKI